MGKSVFTGLFHLILLLYLILRGNLSENNTKIIIIIIIAQNNAIRTNYIQAKIDNIQPNSKCRICENRYETVYHIMSDRIKLAQKEC